MKIKGVILAAGKGTRLGHLTKSMSKPLLPIGGIPMIRYPIRKLVEIGVTDITVVVDKRYRTLYEEMLGDGGDSNVTLRYVFQEEPLRGMPHAILSAEQSVAGADGIVVLCGDVIIEGKLLVARVLFERYPRHAVVLSGYTPDSAGYSRISTNGDSVRRISPKRNTDHREGYIDLGGALYPRDVFAMIRKLFPSDREVAVTALHKKYLSINRLLSVKIHGFWSDAGKSIKHYSSLQSRYESA